MSIFSVTVNDTDEMRAYLVDEVALPFQDPFIFLLRKVYADPNHLSISRIAEQQRKVDRQSRTDPYAMSRATPVLTVKRSVRSPFYLPHAHGMWLMVFALTPNTCLNHC